MTRKLFVVNTNTYEKNLKKILKSGKISLTEIQFVVKKIINREILETKYKDHKLSGNLNDCRECHIKPNILLIYKICVSRHVLSVIEVEIHFV